VIEVCDSHDEKSIKLLEERILKIHPNTYTFTKNLAEQIVSSNSTGFPVAIVRPSIISASLKEPCPGWLSNITAYTGISINIYNVNSSSSHISFTHIACKSVQLYSSDSE
jgi:alcohol-forming fatty acyl-CoA reductase